jgi:hypothetical protein
MNRMLTPPIDRTRQSDASRRKAPVRTAAGSGFAQHVRDAAADGIGPAQAPSAVTALDALLEAQRVDPAGADAERQAAAEYADGLLDGLQVLQVDLLEGRVPAGRLAALSRLLRGQQRRSGDSRLDEIVETIELRAQIELAKLQRTS